MLTSPDHLAHQYVDIGHRAALLYAFATLLVAVVVEFSSWPHWVDLTAAVVMVFFFVGAILSYVIHGFRRDTTNQMSHPTAALRLTMTLLIGGEIGGFTVLLAGFIHAYFR